MRLRSGGMTTSAARRWAAPAVRRRRRRHPHLHHVRGGRRPTRTRRSGGHRPREPGSPTWRWGRPTCRRAAPHAPSSRASRSPRSPAAPPTRPCRGRSRRWSRPRRTTPTPMRRRRPWPTRPRLSGRPTAWPRRATRHGSRPWRSPVRWIRRRHAGLPGPGGLLPDQGGWDDVRGRLAAAGHPASSVFTGWDGQAGARGPWRLEVVTIDPRRFHGRLDASYGPDLRDRETTSALSRAAGATVGVNGGFFVLDPASGAPGDPARGRRLRRPAALGADGRSTGAGPAVGRPGDVGAAAVVEGRGRPRGRDDGPGRHQPGAGPDPELRWRPHRPADGTAAARHRVRRRQRARRRSPRSTARRRRPARGARSSSTRTPSSGPAHRPGAPPCRRGRRRSRGPGRWPRSWPVSTSVTGSGCAPGWSTTTAAPSGPDLTRRSQRRSTARAGRRWDFTCARTAWCRRPTRGSSTDGRSSATRGPSPAWTRRAAPCWSPRTGAAPLTWA